MKRVLLAIAIGGLMAFGFWIWHKSMSPDVSLPNEWKTGSREQREKAASFSPILPSDLNVKLVEACKKLLTKSTGMRKSDVDTTRVLQSEDRSFYLFIFRQRTARGPSYVFCVDRRSGKITDNFCIPDA
jgi:hypothetical protein